MSTTVIGFRLGWDAKGRQATVLLTQGGVLHQSSGQLGLAPRPTRPHAPAAPDPHPVPRQAATLRKLYAELIHRGYTRELIAPACVRLDVDEHPLHPRPYGDHAPRAHPELIRDFTGAAPAGHGSLEEALTDFYTAIGLAPRPRAARPGGAPPAVREGQRALAEGRALTGRLRRGAGWTVTATGVRLHVGPAGENLTPREVADLQAALSAWLRHQRQPEPIRD
ncbi:hypothetical protein [Streptomyces sp. NPDC089919]|uniref:hypothetical protein n=1 Tax=Streptomyces sp. NPDC089919 TaxID=3155188 RepID=UPI0034171FC8